MPDLALKIDQRMSQIGIDFQQPRVELNIKREQMDVEVTQPQIELEITHPYIEKIDNKRTLASMGYYLDIIEFSNKVASDWQQDGANFVRVKAQQGDMLADISHGTKVADTIQVWDNNEAFNYNLGAIPSVMPEIIFYTADPGVNVIPGQVKVSAMPGSISVDSLGGKVDITLTEPGYLHISAVPKPEGLDILV
ncbi:MAG: DUF6470 family protein [Methylocystaceae bacterium]